MNFIVTDLNCKVIYGMFSSFRSALDFQNKLAIDSIYSALYHISEINTGAIA